MLSVCWDWRDVVFFELLPRNQTINSDVYCRQLNKLNAAVKEKRPELVNRKCVIFHHDNATPHTSFPCGNCQIFALLQVWPQLGKLLFGYNMSNVLDVA